MKIKLPFVLRSTYEKETSELVKDIKVLETAKDASDKKIASLKGKLTAEESLNYYKRKDDEREIKTLKIELEKKDKEIKELKWCIQERDKELEDVRTFNLKLFNKVKTSNEMYRQFKDKVDKACEIDFVTRTLTSADIKKFMKVEDVVELYTLIGIAGK